MHQQNKSFSNYGIASIILMLIGIGLVAIFGQPSAGDSSGATDMLLALLYTPIWIVSLIILIVSLKHVGRSNSSNKSMDGQNSNTWQLVAVLFSIITLAVIPMLNFLFSV